ncbi:uncharacterized protein B0H18DRAFT_616892 [Fomitopsis serialis]|uniref:uncharacterized protein n=1 Tax=Fomitopsis serialis TaxID=139415 RepID=UPI00200795B0|nr:uncharacterized protein B0H18DRAFT_616892 [Neoantrodia serialis]KAH9920076.1 hypothetical protein B0H18DRAFT_616892 [Neoantrodia serialis]
MAILCYRSTAACTILTCLRVWQSSCPQNRCPRVSKTLVSNRGLLCALNNLYMSTYVGRKGRTHLPKVRGWFGVFAKQTEMPR